MLDSKFYKIAVVILNWNGKKYLEQFLPSVVNNTRREDCVIIVTDNGSTDKSIEFLTSCYPSIHLIRNDKNLGFSGGYNEALSQIESEYYVLLNSDVEVTSGWLDPIISLMDSDPQIAACQPKIKSYHNKNSYEYAGAAGGFIDKFGYPFCRGRILNVVEDDIGQYDNSIQVLWATGACLFVKSKYFWEVGGLDPDFFAHMEEIDLCWRLKNRGYHIIVESSVCIFHVGGGTLPNNNPRKLYLNYRNNLYILYKNLPTSKLFLTIFIRLILDGISGFIYLISGSFSFFLAVLKAHFAFYSNIRSLKKKREWLIKYNNIQVPDEIYKGSIVFDFFIRKKKKFSDLNLGKFSSKIKI